MRYSIGFGKIITPINSEIAHGMYGEGFTKTRNLLEKSKKDKRRRIDVLLPIKKFNEIINDLFFVYQSFLDNWKKKDYEIIKEFYENRDYKAVAQKLRKGNDQIWKREKNLRVREFFEMQDIIFNISKLYTALYKTRANTELQNTLNQEFGELIWGRVVEDRNKKKTKSSN